MLSLVYSAHEKKLFCSLQREFNRPPPGPEQHLTCAVENPQLLNTCSPERHMLPFWCCISKNAQFHMNSMGSTSECTKQKVTIYINFKKWNTFSRIQIKKYIVNIRQNHDQHIKSFTEPLDLGKSVVTAAVFTVVRSFRACVCVPCLLAKPTRALSPLPQGLPDPGQQSG